MDLRAPEVKSSGAEERLARAYEERERLELLVYEAAAVRAAVVRGIALDLDAARGGGEGHPTDPRRAELGAATRMLVELTARLARADRRVAALLGRTP